jgi:AraC family transcriptional regulator
MYANEKGVLDNSYAFFHTPSNIAKSMFFYIKCAGHFYCDNNYCVERDNHDSYLLMYVKEGSGVVHYNNKIFNVKANDVVLLNCHRPHMYKTENWETLWVHFSGNMSDEYYQLLYNRFGCVISLQDSKLITDHISTILDTFKNADLLNEAIISCYIQRMLTELLIIPSNTTQENHDKPNAVLESINYIQNNYSKKITLEQLAENVCISPFYFSRIFKRETGYSPYEYITMVRLNHAKTLLKTNDMLIKEIAFSVGFNSEANFVTCFKEHVDMTPSKFRKTSF